MIKDLIKTTNELLKHQYPHKDPKLYLLLSENLDGLQSGMVYLSYKDSDRGPTKVYLIRINSLGNNSDTLLDTLGKEFLLLLIYGEGPLNIKSLLSGESTPEEFMIMNDNE